jgi:hypothetical protein
MKVVFKLTPDALKIMRAFNYTSKNFKKKAESAVKEMAVQCSRRVKSSITKQTVDVPPLSEAWVAKKARLHLDPKYFLATHKYITGIKPAQSGHLSWGVLADVDRAVALELGTYTSPIKPRPHWVPVLHEMEKLIPVIVNKKILNVVLKSLGTSGF